MADLDGRSHWPLQPGSGQVSVLIFLMPDCPIANAYAPEINAIVREYSGHGACFFVVHVDPSVRLELAMNHARDFGFRCPVLIDSSHALVRAVEARTSPEVAIITADGAVAYRGRIDDRFIAFGKQRAAPSRRDLREALDAVLVGRPVAEPGKPAVGCPIPDLHTGSVSRHARVRGA